MLHFNTLIRKFLFGYANAFGRACLKLPQIHLTGIDYGQRWASQKKRAYPDGKAFIQALHHRACAVRILCESPIWENDTLNMNKAWTNTSGERRQKRARMKLNAHPPSRR
jgi:hypothetical protein